jgi:hypothetical protein
LPLFPSRALVITTVLVLLMHALFQRKFSRQLADPAREVDYHSEESLHSIEDISKCEFE